MPIRPLVRQSGTNTISDKNINEQMRLRIWFGVLAVISAIFVVRLFYLQVIKHDFYRQAALHGQFKEYDIPPERGIINARDGNNTAALVLNEQLFTLFADPAYIKNAGQNALAIANIIHIDANKIKTQLETKDTRYVVLAKKLPKDQAAKLDKLRLKGVGTRAENYRTYPQGSLASQLLGFVNADGKGQYGIEEFLDINLHGSAGELKAITDASGIPLVANKDNIVTKAKPGSDITLTVDINVQRATEDLLKAGLDKYNSKSGSAIIMNPNNGAILAMANYPSYDPANFQNYDDSRIYSNATVTTSLEVGSVMKSLTSSSVLDQKALDLNSSFFDDGFVKVDDHTITDVTNSRGTQTIQSVLVSSLNTGAVWMLKSMGGGEINAKGRKIWHDYLTGHFNLGSLTGIEQAGEDPGFIPKNEDNGQAINFTYANTAFGQAMRATPMQMLTAFASVVNGGTLYRPRLVDSITTGGQTMAKKPEIIHERAISPDISNTMVGLLARVAQVNIPGISRNGYIFGGKTGTAQIANLDKGGYYTDRFNGTYLGFVGGDKPQYVITVEINDPHIAGFAGGGAAAPIYRTLAHMLIDNYGVTPKTN